MRKFKFLIAILSFMVFFGSLASCTPSESSQDSSSLSSSSHTCESVCEECNKCLDAECTETACADKCQGHTVTPPAHTCQSVCDDCGKCTNADCEEAVCEDKCEGHMVTPPAHECESVCPTCQKCTDEDCEEAVCEDKCEGHMVTPPAHECESVCPTCQKCTDEDCEEAVCEDKCEGHNESVVDPNWSSYELDFISYNVLIPGGNDASNNAYWDGGRGKACVNFINTCGADIIGLQECNTAPYRDISKGLASHYAMVYTNTETADGMIYDKTIFNLVETDMYNLPKADGTSTKRMAIALILEHRATGEKIKAINTHAQNGKDFSGQRKAGFEYIAQRSLSDEDYKFTVMLGDFNASLNYSADYASISNKLQDCRVNAIDSPNRDKGTFHDFKSRTVIYDYIFVTKSEDVEVLYYAVREDKWGDNQDLSDHYPVQAKVRIHNPNYVWTEFY